MRHHRFLITSWKKLTHLFKIDCFISVQASFTVKVPANFDDDLFNVYQEVIAD